MIVAIRRVSKCVLVCEGIVASSFPSFHFPFLSPSSERPVTALFKVKVIVLFFKISEGFISGALIWKGCLVLSMTCARGTRVTVRVSTTPRGCGLGLEQNLGLPILNFVDVDCNCPEPDPYLFCNSAGSNSPRSRQGVLDLPPLLCCRYQSDV